MEAASERARVRRRRTHTRPLRFSLIFQNLYLNLTVVYVMRRSDSAVRRYEPDGMRCGGLNRSVVTVEIDTCRRSRSGEERRGSRREA